MGIQKPLKKCTTFGCREKTRDGGKCVICLDKQRRWTDKQRGSASDRGYTAWWAKFAKEYINKPNHILCFHKLPGCTIRSELPDHYPKSRKILLAEGVRNPDHPSFLVPSCKHCHSIMTQLMQGGGFGDGRNRGRQG